MNKDFIKGARKSTLFFIPILISFFSLATEIDSFTNRYDLKTDSTPKLDLYVNDQIEKSLITVNTQYSCQSQSQKAEEAFYSHLYKSVGGFLWAKIEDKIADTYFVEKIRLKQSQSIYRDINLIESPIFKFAKLGAIIKLNGRVVGTDKLGHFIGIGWEYFKRADLKNRGVKKALQYGHLTELTYFGYLSTGIYSHADLVANYDGYQFWRNLFDSKKSPSDDPYIECQNGNLVQLRRFSWNEYITDAWDEGINCNKFRSPSMKNKIDSQVLRLEQLDSGRRYQCPIRRCQGLDERYPEALLNC